jgi:hypothetical protein
MGNYYFYLAYSNFWFDIDKKYIKCIIATEDKVGEPFQQHWIKKL